MTLTPLSDWLLVSLLPPEERTAGGIEIPEVARWQAYDGHVIACGPESAIPAGHRVVCEKAAFRGLDEGLGFVRAREAAAVIAGPAWTVLEPWGRYVMVRPDLRAQETESGVLVAHNALPGDRAREVIRGIELWREFRSWSESPRFRERYPEEWEQRKMIRARQADLPMSDRMAMRVALDRGLHKDGTEEDAEHLRMPSASGVLNRPIRGEVLGVGPEVRAGVRAGQAVYWDRAHEWVGLSWGTDYVELVAEGDLAAAEEEA